MNSSKPASVNFSFAGFAERGGRTGEHSDGWGIALHGANDCHLIVDYQAAIHSPLAEALKTSKIKARNVVAHIRKATQGVNSLANSHPFTRNLWGRTWSFAHNGDLGAYQPPRNARYVPRGQTDSERAFCHLLATLLERFPDGQPPRRELFDAVAAISASIARQGSFNFILSNGEFMFAYCSTRLHYVVREYPFVRAQLVDCDTVIDFNQHNHLDDRMTVIATEPLSHGEQWFAFEPGELRMFADGVPHAGSAREVIKRPQLRFTY
jgi:glutamine amidotransferase